MQAMLRGGSSNKRQGVRGHHLHVFITGLDAWLIHIVSAFCEIKHYQQRVVEGTFIPPRAFQKLVKQISYQHGKFRWEKDAIVALQAVSENVLTMVFEMTYCFLAKLTDVQQLFGNSCKTPDCYGQRHDIASRFIEED